MLAKLKTLACVSQPRNRAGRQAPSAPLTAEEKKDNREDAAKKQQKIDDAIGEWWAYTMTTANDLAQRFDKKPRYFLDIMFQGGVCQVHRQEKPNAYNAFKAMKAAEMREAGVTDINAGNLHDVFHQEYLDMTPEAINAMVEEFGESKDEFVKLRRDSPRARIQDVSNSLRNIEMVFQGLMCRVGIEGFFCVVRNTTDFHMVPHWYFTSQALERFMPMAVVKKWDTSQVAAKLKAFAVAGCDPATADRLRNSKQKSDFLKVEIRHKLSDGLIEIRGNPKARISYEHYYEDVVSRYVSPSNLSASIPVLTKLRDALNDGDCKWVKLRKSQLKHRAEKWAENVAAGRAVPKERNERSDKGKKRKIAEVDDDDDARSSDENSDERPEEVYGDGRPVTPPGQSTSSTRPPAKHQNTAKVATVTEKPRKPKKKGGNDNDNDERAASGDEQEDDDQPRTKKRRIVSRQVISDDEDEEDPSAATTSAASGNAAATSAASGIPASPSAPLTSAAPAGESSTSAHGEAATSSA
ncbi:hypothetical protein C8R43DRAFT_1123006 [Mycena crocata]|nr:hypothetical protein C8R43DRAFT_1123006 [Mycena crocata]